MKNLLLSAAAFALLLTSACKKGDDGPGSSWTVGSTTYGAVYTYNAFGDIVGSTVSATSMTYPYNTIVFHFASTGTPAAGTYKVVQGDNPGANEISFDVSNVTSASDAVEYSSTGAGTVNATVTVSGDKASISMPSAPAQRVSGSETVNVTANLSQNL